VVITNTVPRVPSKTYNSGKLRRESRRGRRIEVVRAAYLLRILE